MFADKEKKGKIEVLPLLVLLSLFTGAVWVLFHSSQAFFTDNFSCDFEQ